ncbi:MAG: hypothetical protein LBM96_02095 [Methanobrevibacter sp.]|jgi:hypothetical protein|nr:hypothetical protein [Candidatus Methanoflexus mossambicus]
MNNEIIIYNTEEGLTKVELQLNNGTVWLIQMEIVKLFQTTKQNISRYIRHVKSISNGELDENSVVNYKLTTAK